MIKYYCSEQNRITEIESPGEDCWISLVNPTEAEVAAMVNQYGIDADAMRSALDTDERSRIETDENYVKNIFFGYFFGEGFIHGNSLCL